MYRSSYRWNDTQTNLEVTKTVFVTQIKTVTRVCHDTFELSQSSLET